MSLPSFPSKEGPAKSLFSWEKNVISVGNLYLRSPSHVSGNQAERDLPSAGLPWVAFSGDTQPPSAWSSG